MLDEMDNVTGHETYYTNITNYAHGLSNWSDALIVGNPGTSTIAGYVGTVDCMIIWEGNGSLPDQTTLNTRTFNGVYPKSNFAVNAYNLPAGTALDRNWLAMAETRIVMIGVTDDVLPNPYDTIPAYLESFFQYLLKGITIPHSETQMQTRIKVRQIDEDISFSTILVRVSHKARTIHPIIPISTTLTSAPVKTREVDTTIPISVTPTLVVTKGRLVHTDIPISTTTTFRRLKFRAIAASIPLTNVLLSRIALKRRTLALTIPHSETRTMRRLKARTLSVIIPISTTLSKIAPRSMEIAISIPISVTPSKIKKTFRTLSTTIPTSTTLTFKTIFQLLISATIPISTTLLPMVRHKFRTIATNIRINVRPTLSTAATWVVSGQNSDFPDKLDNLISAYISSKWSAIVDPQIGANLEEEISQNNFEYDSFRTYYIKITEGQSRVINRQTRQRLYEFETPILLECTVRSLSKGETFAHLNDMINELLRIFGEFQQEEIFGIQGITLDSITPMDTDPATRSVFKRTLQITLRYFKVDRSH